MFLFVLVFYHETVWMESINWSEAQNCVTPRKKAPAAKRVYGTRFIDQRRTERQTDRRAEGQTERQRVKILSDVSTNSVAADAGHLATALVTNPGVNYCRRISQCRRTGLSRYSSATPALTLLGYVDVEFSEWVNSGRGRRGYKLGKILRKSFISHGTTFSLQNEHAQSGQNVLKFFQCSSVNHTCNRNNISSKIVPLEKGVVLYGANALSLLPVVLFILSTNVHVWLFLVTFLVCVRYGSVQ